MSTILPLLVLLADTPTPASSVPPADPKLVAIVEQNRGEYEGCMADVEAKHPPRAPETVDEFNQLAAKKKRSTKDNMRILELAEKATAEQQARKDGQDACRAQFMKLLAPKFKQAGADLDAAAAAVAHCWTAWSTGTSEVTPPAR